MQKEKMQRVFQTYVLTVWQEPRVDREKGSRWHFLLADPNSGRGYGFMNPEGLLLALQQLDPAAIDEAETR
jgi:hypothetical protein